MNMSKHTFSKQFLSMILSIALLITLLTPTNLTAYADQDENGMEHVAEEIEREEPEEGEQYSDPADDTVPNREFPADGEEPLQLNDETEEAAIVSEDEHGKDLYTKDFLLADTTRLLVVYPDAVPFEKDAGEWTSTTGVRRKSDFCGEDVQSGRAVGVELEWGDIPLRPWQPVQFRRLQADARRERYQAKHEPRGESL